MPLLQSQPQTPPAMDQDTGHIPPACDDGDCNRHHHRRILFLDAYDSFTNNIVSLLKEALGSDVLVYVLHMDLRTLHSDAGPDWTADQFLARLPSFDAVVCGPGPGSPLCDADVGAFRLLWNLPRDKAVPVLGICLGFQSLVAHFGGGIRKLRRGLHGMVRAIGHRGGEPLADIFDGVPAFKATLYHSLCADVGQDSVVGEAWDQVKWLPPKVAPDLLPLAWTTEIDEHAVEERILMGVRHASLPLWGVQYHPESVCTDEAAHGVLRNWFKQALKWNESTGRQVQPANDVEFSDSLDPSRLTAAAVTSQAALRTRKWWSDMQSGLAASMATPLYTCRRIKLPDGVDAADVAEILGGQETNESIMLDSSSTITGDPLARNSIIALEVDTALRFEYHVGDNHVTLRRPGTSEQGAECQRIEIDSSDEHGTHDVWNIISDFWQRGKVADEDGDQPVFKGGFMGFVTYEMGLAALSPGAISKARDHHRPDLCMAWVSRSIVLDHQAGVGYIQSLSASSSQPGDQEAWINNIIAKLEAAEAWKSPAYSPEAYKALQGTAGRTNESLLDDVRKAGGVSGFKIPNSEKYEDDVRRCQDAIREGHSYELCLTAQTTMTRPSKNSSTQHLQSPTHTNGTHSAPQTNGTSTSTNPTKHHNTPWQIYRTLRARQPAPFGSFIRLGGATIISSSPERFLTHNPEGLCSMRPMKGTVRKSEAVSTLEQAEKILHIPKEEAENLMIVDLVRHDLHGVCGVGNVTVPELLKVEEYATVFQMITVVNGQLPTTQDATSNSGLTGLDVLAAALPPGSMTGAPKKRSCELLKVIEPTERSLYSGVVGYLDVKGQGDWSVTIRTMFHWDDEVAPPEEGETEPREVWRIGAGGAVTTLSTPEGEREEMFTKLCGPLGVFKDMA